MGRSEIGKKKKQQIRRREGWNLEGKCIPCPDVVKTAERGITRCVMLRLLPKRAPKAKTPPLLSLLPVVTFCFNEHWLLCSTILCKPSLWRIIIRTCPMQCLSALRFVFHVQTLHIYLVGFYGVIIVLLLPCSAFFVCTKKGRASSIWVLFNPPGLVLLSFSRFMFSIQCQFSSLSLSTTLSAWCTQGHAVFFNCRDRLCLYIVKRKRREKNIKLKEFTTVKIRKYVYAS